MSAAEEKELGQLIDASTGESLSVVVPVERYAKEVLTMMLGEDQDDVLFGRMPVGGAGDASEFDALAKTEIEVYEQVEDDDDVTVAGEMFESELDTFPMFRRALRRAQAEEARPKTLRVDTETTHGNFVCERAVEELSRRITELRELVEAHLTDGHGPDVRKLRHWQTEVLGAAEAVADLRMAKDAREAVSKMPEVPVDLPPFAQGKVDCWRSGDQVVCSVRFLTADGKKRVATMAARPRVDGEEAAALAFEAGVEPAMVIGAVQDAAEVACGKRLVRETARGALSMQKRAEVLGMEEGGGGEPLLFVRQPDESAAPLAALMEVEQRAQAGDRQARREMGIIERAAQTPAGRQIAAPLVAEARARLSRGQKMRALHAKVPFAERYAMMGMCV
jgi:hypothetical protein